MLYILKKIKFNSTFLLFIFCYSLLTVGSTYAFLEFEDTNSTVSGVGGCSGVNYTGEEITGASLVGATSYTEGASSIVTLSKDEDCAIYTISHIKIHTNETTTAPITSNQALRYKVEKISGDGEILSGGEGFINQIGDMTLATVTLTENVTTYKVYIWVDVTLTNGLYNDKTYSGYIFAESVQTSTIAPDTAPDTPVITRVDYDTFRYSATDNVATTGYYVSNSNVAPTESSNWSTNRTYDIGGVGTYYVWARDINGNISEAASISAYTITRSVGTGSNLVTRYDSISEDTGTEFTSNLVVLEGTPIYVKAINNSGYASPTLTSTGGTVTNGSYVSITSDTTFTSSAVVGNYSIEDSNENIIDYAVTLADAISKAYSGNTITLLRNYTDTSNVSVNKKITLDTGSYTLTRSTSSIVIASNGDLTKIGSGTIAGNKANVNAAAYCTITVNGKFTANTGNITSNNGNVIVNGTTGQTVINGASLSTSATGYWGIYNSGTKKEANGYAVVFNSGTISGIAAIDNASTGDVIVSGGTFNCSYGTSCILNYSSGVMKIFNVNVTTATTTAIYNYDNGLLQVGDTSGNASIHSTNITSTVTNGMCLICGNNSTGSNARCYMYSGTYLKSTAGYAVINYNGDYRQYIKTHVDCDSTSHYCLYNKGTSYNKVSEDEVYGRMFVRNGYVEAGYTAVYSKVENTNGVRIGNTTDTLYTFSTYLSHGWNKYAEGYGPFILGVHASSGYGVYITSDYHWNLGNGIVGGNYKASNKTPNVTRSGYTYGSYVSGERTFYSIDD